MELAIGEQVVVGEAELPLAPGVPTPKVCGRTTSAAELKISAQRLDPSGGAAPLPIVIELPERPSIHMAEVGGMTTLAVPPGDWTIMVRHEDGGGSRPPSSPLDRL